MGWRSVGAVLRTLRIEAKSLASSACRPEGRKCSSSEALNPLWCQGEAILKHRKPQMTLFSGYSMIPKAPLFNNLGMSSLTTFSETMTSIANQSL